MAEISGPAWIPACLAALAESGNSQDAILASGRAQSTVYSQRRANQAFADAWRAAVDARRAEDGAPNASQGRGPGWRRTFFDALAATSNVKAAAAEANTPIATLYKLRRDDPGFAAQWRAALLEGYDHLEMELLGYLRDPAPKRKMDVTAALRLLAAHRETAARERALREDDDEEAVRASIDRFLDGMIERQAANEAVLIEARPSDAAAERTDDAA